MPKHKTKKMNKIQFAIYLMALLLCACSEDSNISFPPNGQYELRSCFSDNHFYSDADGGCIIKDSLGIKYIYVSVDVDSRTSVEFNQPLKGKNIYNKEGHLIGDMIYVDGADFYFYYKIGKPITFEFSIDYDGDASENENGNVDVEMGRCAAITQKGTRCKRKAAKGSIYCWQHKYNH